MARLECSYDWFAGKTPKTILIESETNFMLSKIGALLSILNNKKINQTKLALTIIQNKEFREYVMNKTDINTIFSLLLTLFKLYPTLVKSKLISNSLDKLRTYKIICSENKDDY